MNGTHYRHLLISQSPNFLYHHQSLDDDDDDDHWNNEHHELLMAEDYWQWTPPILHSGLKIVHKVLSMMGYN